MQEDLSQYLTKVKRPAVKPPEWVDTSKCNPVYRAIRENAVKTNLPSNSTDFSNDYADI